MTITTTFEIPENVALTEEHPYFKTLIEHLTSNYSIKASDCYYEEWSDVFNRFQYSNGKNGSKVSEITILNQNRHNLNTSIKVKWNEGYAVFILKKIG